MAIKEDLMDDAVETFHIEASQISNRTVWSAINFVKAAIDELGHSLSTYTTDKWQDPYYQLYEAAFWWLCELLAQQRVISQSSGEIDQETLGRLKLRYASSQPKFFFFGGKGLDKGDYERLLTHETFRSLAVKFIQMFHKDKLKGDFRKYGAQPQMATDEDYTNNWLNV